MPSRVRGKGRKTFLRARRVAAPKGTLHLAKMHVKKDDTVEVLWGVDKGKRGTVLQAMPSDGMVIVQGVNQKWKHLRRTQDNPQGGRIQREMPMHACKVRKVEE